MEVSYSITYYYKNGQIRHATAASELEALDMVRAEIKKDPECCANILMAEFEKSTPHKKSMKVDRYENRGGNVVKLRY